jgi:hypothetical protein
VRIAAWLHSRSARLYLVMGMGRVREPPGINLGLIL